MSAATWIDAENAQAGAQLLRRGSWSVEEFLELPKAASRLELVEGGLLMSPGPASDHQRAARRLANLLETAAPTDWDALAEGNLKLGPSTILRPDVMLVTRADFVITYQPAEVAMVVEIVSPGSKRIDRLLKPQMYAAAGIRWSMRIELRGSSSPSPEVIVYQLKDGDYVEHTRVHAGQVLHLTEPVEVSFDPALLLRRRL